MDIDKKYSANPGRRHVNITGKNEKILVIRAWHCCVKPIGTEGNVA